MTNLKGTAFPDFSTLQTELSQILSPLCDRAELRVQYPLTDFDISSPKPTITVSIKNASIYSVYQKLAETAPYPVSLTVAVGIYLPKSSDSAVGYELFSEVTRLLCESALAVERVVCDEMEYVPELRHYRLKVEAKLKPFDTKEESDGNTDL